MGFLIGQAVGDYVVLRQIEQYGAGRTYAVEHTITRRSEAMKVLAGETQCTAARAGQFFREIQLQASLSHPNIAAVYNAFWADDDLVLVGEILSGEPLRGSLARGPLNLAQSLDIIRQTLAALSHAHSHGVIHRHISPDSIFLTREGIVKVVDFGLGNGAGTGAAAYASPEQVRGGSTIDARSDLYSCGAVLYEMVTGIRAAPPEEGAGAAHEQTKRARVPACELDSSLPAELDRIFELALASKPQERFQSADEFHEAVARLRHSLHEKPAAGPKVTRLRAAMLVAAAVLVLLVAAVAQPVRPDPKLQLPAQKATGAMTSPVAKTRQAQPPASSSEAKRRSGDSKNPLAKVARGIKRINPFKKKEPAAEPGK